MTKPSHPAKPASAANSKNSAPLPENASTGEFYRGDDYRIEESIGYLIKLSHSALQRDIDVLMQPLEMTAMQWAPLLFILHGKGDTAAEIARCGGTDTGAVTRMLDRLQAKGLLQRKRSSEDRRLIHLELTDAGREIAEKVPYALAECLNKRLRDFSPQEVDTLKSLLRRLLANDES